MNNTIAARKFLFPMIATAIVFVLNSIALAADADSSTPNIVLIMADDMGWGDTGYNGHPHLKTPNIDAMASGGMIFNRFYSAAPVCSPTRGSCLTGRHPYRYGIPFANTGHMPQEEILLSEVLKKRDYATGHFGKWHLGTLTTEFPDANRGGPKNRQHFSPPWKHSFDHSFSTESKVPTWDPLVKPKGAGKTWWDPVANRKTAQPYGTHYFLDGKVYKGEMPGDDSKLIVDHAIEFIEDSVSSEKPFFTVVWFHAPHLPVVAGEEYTKPYTQFDKHTQHYYGCIAALDEQVGRLRGKLRELKIADNTMVCFCSDNGPEGNAKSPGSAAKFRGRKRSLYEGGIRVPGIIEWPARIAAGSSTEFPAVTSDYFPTVLEILGEKSSDDRPVDGISLLQVLKDPKIKRHSPIGFQTPGQIALIDNRFKIYAVEPKNQKRKNRSDSENGTRTKVELYDLLADPSEANNIAADNEEQVKQMVSTFEKWRKSCAASARGEDY